MQIIFCCPHLLQSRVKGIRNLHRCLYMPSQHLPRVFSISSQTWFYRGGLDECYSQKMISSASLLWYFCILERMTCTALYSKVLKEEKNVWKITFQIGFSFSKYNKFLWGNLKNSMEISEKIKSRNVSNFSSKLFKNPSNLTTWHSWPGKMTWIA